MKKILCFITLASFGASASSPSLTELAHQKNVILTKREARVARIGEISEGRQVSGGILGTYPLGFGMGHAIQGRWQDDGKFFTYTELGALGLMAASGPCVGKIFSNADNDCGGLQEVLLLSGLISFVGLRVWEIVDVWKAPGKQNRRYKHLKDRLEALPDAPSESKAEPDLSLNIIPIMGPLKSAGLGVLVKF